MEERGSESTSRGRSYLFSLPLWTVEAEDRSVELQTYVFLLDIPDAAAA